MRLLLWFGFLTLFVSLESWSQEDVGTFYRDEIDSVVLTESCGSLCVSSPNYFQSYLFYRERNSRFYAPGYEAEAKKELTPEDYIKRYQDRDHLRGLSWGPDSRVGGAIIERPVRWSRLARDVGFLVSERGKSISSAFWAEIRKPVLFEVRDKLLRPYRGKSLSLGEKVNAWVLDQTVDSGASSLGFDSYGGVAGSDNLDFGITNYRLKFNPRMDPIRGRYGLRLKYRRYLKNSRPIFTAFNYNYCDSNSGFGNKFCLYNQEFSTSLAVSNMSQRSSCSVYLSYQTESLDEGVYVVDGEPYDHKPWLAGVRFTYAFYR